MKQVPVRKVKTTLNELHELRDNAERELKQIKNEINENKFTKRAEKQYKQQLLIDIQTFLKSKGYNHPDDQEDLFVCELFKMLED